MAISCSLSKFLLNVKVVGNDNVHQSLKNLLFSLNVINRLWYCIYSQGALLEGCVCDILGSENSGFENS